MNGKLRLFVIALAIAGCGFVLHQARSSASAEEQGAAGTEPLTEIVDAEGDEPALDQVEEAPIAEAPWNPPSDIVQCVVPDVAIEESRACQRGQRYPRCKWGMPDPREADYLYDIWRFTTPNHRAGRPALVKTILAASASYAAMYPGENLTVGDLDAPGPRHMTHRTGVDVDLYLQQSMETENQPTGRRTENYVGEEGLVVRMLRQRVFDLARVLTVCTGGNIRIYYNDPKVRHAFNRWFEDQGFESSFGLPMQEHNDLHRFHFHVTIDPNVEVRATEVSATPAPE